jgi:hypothetical protein
MAHAKRVRNITKHRLGVLISEIIAKAGDDELTTNQVVQAALPGARDIAAADHDMVLCELLKRLTLVQLKRVSIAEPVGLAIMLPITGAPERIAVPPPPRGDEPIIDDEDADANKWVSLHKATIVQLGRHCAMLNAHVEGATRRADKMKLLWDSAIALSPDNDEATIEELFGIAEPDADAA